MDRRSGDAVIGVLVRARKLIETPEKWCQFAPWGVEQLCVGSALDQAVADLHPSDRSHYGYVSKLNDQSWEVMRRVLGFKMRLIGEWNDAPSRTHAEVLAALDAAIALRASEIA